MDLNVTSRHQENNMISSKIYKTGYFKDVALMRSELWTPPSHMYGKESDAQPIEISSWKGFLYWTSTFDQGSFGSAQEIKKTPCIDEF